MTRKSGFWGARRLSLYPPSVPKSKECSPLPNPPDLCPFVTAACVGDMLYTGTGCLRDYGAALRYYVRAAHAGEATSANAAGLMHELGRGVPRNLEVANFWYQKAATLG